MSWSGNPCGHRGPSLSDVIVYDSPAIIKSRPRRWLEGLRSYFMGPMSLKDPALSRYFGSSGRSTSGVTVTQENAFTFSAVYDAVNQISSDVAKLPLNLRKRNPSGGSDPYEDSKTHRLLKYEPNPEMGSMVFRRTVTAHALTWHGGFSEIERDGAGRPVAIWPLAPDKVKVEREKTGRRRLYFKVRGDDGAEVNLDPANVLHIVGLGYDPFCAYPVITLARQAIGLGLAAEQFGSTFFGNGTTFGGVLSMVGINSEEEAQRLRDVIKARHTGPERANDMLVTWGDMKYTPNGVAPQNAQMNELRSKQVEEVARFFNIPVHKLKNLEHATFSNIEQQDLEYYKGCLLNWITLWEEECNRKLIPSLESRQQFVKHNANAFLRADTTARTALYTALLDRGVFNADQVLEYEDLNPQPGGQGQLYLVQGAMVPKDQIVDLVDAQIEKAKAPPPQPTPQPAADKPPVDETPARMLAELVSRTERAEAEVSLRAKNEAAASAAKETAEKLSVLLTDERDRARAETTRAVERETLAKVAVDAELARLATVEAEAHAAVIAAHRGLVVDVMRRMIERETERVRRAQTTPEKLREWMAKWYDGHEALIVDALVPALTVHVAWSRSTDDPRALAKGYASAHVAASKRDVESAIDDGADLASSLAGMLDRWRGRAEDVANECFEREIAHTLK